MQFVCITYKSILSQDNTKSIYYLTRISDMVYAGNCIKMALNVRSGLTPVFYFGLLRPSKRGLEGMASKPKAAGDKPAKYSSVKRDRHGLTPSQAAYVRERMKGKSQRQSYIDAGIAQPGTKINCIDVQASHIEHLEVVQNRLKRLQYLADNGAVATLEQLKTQLSEMATDEDRPDDIRLQATRQLTPLLGGDTAKIGFSLPEADEKLSRLLGQPEESADSFSGSF